jgi:uncharacterized membrane protein required for colicin V production
MVDVVLVLLLGGAFLFGFFQGVIRGVLSIAAWFVVFIVAANLSEPVGTWLNGQWVQFSPGYNLMLAFGMVALLLFALAFVLIQLGTRNTATLSRHPLLDDVLGGLLGLTLAVLLLAALIVVLESHYATVTPVAAAQDAAWSAELYRTLQGSAVSQLVRDLAVPALGAIMEFALPANVRAVMR